MAEQNERMSLKDRQAAFNGKQIALLERVVESGEGKPVSIEEMYQYWRDRNTGTALSVALGEDYYRTLFQGYVAVLLQAHPGYYFATFGIVDLGDVSGYSDEEREHIRMCQELLVVALSDAMRPNPVEVLEALDEDDFVAGYSDDELLAAANED